MVLLPNITVPLEPQMRRPASNGDPEPWIFGFTQVKPAGQWFLSWSTWALKRAWMTCRGWDHSGGGLRDTRVTGENSLMTSQTQQLQNKNTPWKKPEPTCLAVVCLLCTVKLHRSTDKSYLCKQHGHGGTRLFSRSPGKGSFWIAQLVIGQNSNSSSINKPEPGMTSGHKFKVWVLGCWHQRLKVSII